MAIKATNLAKTLAYQSKNDPDFGTDSATTFTLGALDARVTSCIKDKATGIPVSSLGTGEGFATLNINAMNFEVVQFGLKGVTNFDVQYKTMTKQLGGKNYTVAHDDVLEAIPEDEIAAMADAVLTINTLSETERKNSEE